MWVSLLKLAAPLLQDEGKSCYLSLSQNCEEREAIPSFCFVYFPPSKSTKKNRLLQLSLIPPKLFLRCEKLYGNCCNLDENIMKPPNFPETISSTVLANLVPEQNQTLRRKQVARTIQSHRAMWDATLFLTYLEVHYTHMPNKCYQRIFPLFALLFRGIFKRHIMSVSLLSATRNLKYPHSAQF